MATRKERDRRQERRSTARARAEKRVSGYEGLAIKLPEGMKYFKVKEAGPRKLEILSYPVTAQHPLVRTGVLKPGDMHFEYTYFAHRNIGPNSDLVLCPASTFKKDCPICNARKHADEAEAEELRPRERQLFQVLDHGNLDVGVQLWDVSYHLFGKELDKSMQAMEDDDPELFFYDNEDGSTVRVMFSEKSFGGRTFFEAMPATYRARSQPLDDEVLGQVVVLDELLKEIPYDKLKALFENGEEDDEEEEDDDKPAPRKRGAKAAKASEEEEEDDPPPRRSNKRKAEEDEDEDDPPPRRGAKAKQPPPEEDDAEEWDDEDPLPKRGAQSKKPPVDDEEEDPPPRRSNRPPVDEDEEDEPAPKRGAKSAPKSSGRVSGSGKSAKADTPSKGKKAPPPEEDDEDDWGSEEDDESDGDEDEECVACEGSGKNSRGGKCVPCRGTGSKR